VSSGRPTATLETDVSRLPAQGCERAFLLVLGKRTSAMNSLMVAKFVWALKLEIATNSDILFKLRLWKFSNLFIYLLLPLSAVVIAEIFIDDVSFMLR